MKKLIVLLIVVIFTNSAFSQIGVMKVDSVIKMRFEKYRHHWMLIGCAGFISSVNDYDDNKRKQEENDKKCDDYFKSIDKDLRNKDSLYFYSHITLKKEGNNYIITSPTSKRIMYKYDDGSETMCYSGYDKY